MTLKTSCPDKQVLLRLMLGQLPAAEAESVVEHVAECGLCATTAQILRTEQVAVPGLAEPVFVTPPPPPAAPESAVVRQLLDRLDQASVRHSTSDVEADCTQFWSALLSPPQGPGELGRLGAYRVLKVLGAGGMGMVFQAEDSQLQRPVALKVMKPALNANAEARGRFLREARAAAAIKHDHIITIYQVGEDHGIPFLAMELLQGEALSERLQREGRLPWREAVRLGRQVALALAAAHQAGLVHRDIKPANIWLESSGEGVVRREDQTDLSQTCHLLPLTTHCSPSRVKLLDFGLVRLSDDSGQFTQEGAILGTPAYMAPEQANGVAVDSRCDLFSLGCVLYHATTGKLPFEGRDMLTRMMALANTDPCPPHDVDPQIPKALSDLILELLAKDAKDRPAAALAVAQRLEAIASGKADAHTARAGMTAAPAPRPSRLRRWLLVAAALLLVAGGAVLAPQIMIRLTRDGKTEEFTLKPGDRLEVVVKPNTPTKPGVPVLPDKAKPFTLVWANGKDREDFKDFADLMSAYQDGDAIEVHGNGPFTLAPLYLSKKGLTLKAAPGYRPVFVSAEGTGAWIQVNDAPLLLDGCDFRAVAGTHAHLFAGDGPWDIRNCRVVGSSFTYGIYYTGPKLRLTDSLIVYGDNSPLLDLHAKTDCDVTNCILSAANLITLGPTGGQTLRLQNSTCQTLVVLTLPGADTAEPVAVTAAGNVFYSGGIGCGLSGWTPAWKDKFRWKGDGNLYVGSPVVMGPDHQWLSHGFDEWTKRFGREPKSRAAADIAFAWQAPRKYAADDALALVRRQNEALRRQHALPDLGPKWDLVGAGDALVRALAAAGTAPAKDMLRPAADLPYVLRRGGKIHGAFPALAAALDKADNGDTIEIRSDGPVPGGQLPGRGRRLTLAAAPGYKPVVHETLGGDDIWSLEGLHFRQALLKSNAGPFKQKIARIASCSFEDAPPDSQALMATFVSSSSGPAEIIHCFIPSQLLAQLPPGEKLLIRNSLVGGIQVFLPDGGAGQLDIDHAALRPTSPIALLAVHGPGQLKLSTRDTWFECAGALLANSNLLADWQGAHNLYAVGIRSWTGEDPLRTLSDWKKRWSSDQTSAVAEPLIHDPSEWRLLPGTPGQQQGPNDTDLGADTSKVAHTPAPSK